MSLRTSGGHGVGRGLGSSPSTYKKNRDLRINKIPSKRFFFKRKTPPNCLKKALQ